MASDRSRSLAARRRSRPRAAHRTTRPGVQQDKPKRWVIGVGPSPRTPDSVPAASQTHASLLRPSSWLRRSSRVMRSRDGRPVLNPLRRAEHSDSLLRFGHVEFVALEPGWVQAKRGRQSLDLRHGRCEILDGAQPICRPGFERRLGSHRRDEGAENYETAQADSQRCQHVLSQWLQAANIHSGPMFRRMRRGDAVGEERLSDQSVALIIKSRASDRPASRRAAPKALRALAARWLRDRRCGRCGRRDRGARDRERHPPQEHHRPAPLHQLSNRVRRRRRGAVDQADQGRCSRHAYGAHARTLQIDHESITCR